MIYIQGFILNQYSYFIIESDKLYKHFEIFTPGVYIGILVSISIMSSIVGLYHRSFKTFLSTFWSYFSVILSDYYSIGISSGVEKLLTGVWLMSCTVLLAAFSGLLRDQSMKPKAILWIDSWHDLYEWKNIKIQIPSVNFMLQFIDNFPDHPYSINFKNRSEIFENVDFESGAKDFDYERVSKGELAIVTGYEYLQILKKNLIKDYKFIENVDFHISTVGDAMQPYFIQLLKARISETLARILDMVYEYKIQIILKLNPS